MPNAGKNADFSAFADGCLGMLVNGVCGGVWIAGLVHRRGPSGSNDPGREGPAQGHLYPRDVLRLLGAAVSSHPRHSIARATPFPYAGSAFVQLEICLSM